MMKEGGGPGYSVETTETEGRKPSRPPPRPSGGLGVPREVAQLLSLPSTLLLMAAFYLGFVADNISSLPGDPEWYRIAVHAGYFLVGVVYGSWGLLAPPATLAGDRVMRTATASPARTPWRTRPHGPGEPSAPGP